MMLDHCHCQNIHSNREGVKTLKSYFAEFHMNSIFLVSRNVVNLRILIVILVCHNKRTAHFPKQSALSQCNAGSCKIKHPLQQMPSAPYIKQQKENKEDNEELPVYQIRVILISQS